ncbi:MAG TPA: hypothetical protein VMT56_02980 [Candidatus Bathyarchaeia archaeon]|nr:hypothetical protein [Candidatus Bathyarchaeia archaeon]
MMDEETRRILDDHEKRIREIESRFSRVESPVREKALSIKEFILTKKPEDDVQRTLVIGYFLEKHKKLASFNVDDLREGFRTAKEPAPGNLNDKVLRNVKNAHMMEAEQKKDSKKAWVLTSSGERLVENGLKTE